METTEEAKALDYRMCSYDGCRLSFRGPPAPMNDQYIAVLGGTEVFGRFIAHPFPDLIQEWTGIPVANLGVAQAGLSLFSEERWLLEAGSRSDVTVLQVLGAQNMTNRLYSVHSRRNDRFLAVSPVLREMYPDVDFTEINFTGHLLERLSQDEIAFQSLVKELKWSWIQRMRRVLELIKGDVILLWMSDRRPEEDGASRHAADPLFVDREMLNELSGEVAGLVEIVTEKDASKLQEMVIGEDEAEAALCLPGSHDHMRAAEALAIKVSHLRGTDPLPYRVRA